MKTALDGKNYPLPDTFKFEREAAPDPATLTSTSTVNEEWSVVTAAELAAKPPRRPPELIHGLLYEGGTMLMSGASKSMKTFTMIAAGLAVSSERDWLGFKCVAAPVIILNLELQDFSMAKRVRDVASAMGIPPPPNFYVANLRGHLVDVGALELSLGKLMEATQARLVIVDPHYKISAASGVEENSNDAQGLLLYRLENAVCKRGASLMIAHHFSKGDKSQTKAIDRAAGGGALARWPDVVMTLTEHEDDGCATAEFSLRDFAPVAPIVVRWSYPTWTRDNTVNPALLKKAGKPIAFPLSAMLETLKDGMSKKEWRAACSYTETTFGRKLDEALSAKKIRIVSGAYYHATP